MGCFTIVEAAQPQSSLWAEGTLHFAIPYWSLTMSLNICVTTLLAVRLLWARHRVRQVRNYFIWSPHSY